MAVALHGNLRDFGIGEVFQLIGQQQKTGFLTIDGKDRQLRVAFEQGAVVWAENKGPYEQAALGDRLVRAGLLTPERLAFLEADLTGKDQGLAEVLGSTDEVSADAIDRVTDLVTTDTIFELLRWKDGSFRFNSQPVLHQRDAQSLRPAEQILMDGLRMVDEWETLEAAATQAGGVYRTLGSFDLYKEAHRNEPPERLAVAERLFLLVDGRLPNQRIIDLSRLGTFDASRLLSAFQRLGVIEAVDPAQLAKARRPGLSSRRRSSPPPLGAMLAAIPFVALVLVVWFASRPLPEGTVPLNGEVLAEADAAYEILRARQLSLAYRYARGSWPRDAAALEDLGVAPLAAHEGGSYYFRRHGDGVVVLAPAP